ncbi:MAG: alpha-amylase family glycosyl hydrolase [Methylococcus sp.]
MRIYNLFPLLAGSVDRWQPHLQRASELGFDWIFVNPIQTPGQSGSLYSVKDYFSINPSLIAPESPVSPEDQVRATIRQAEQLGLSMMVDLVINHCAYDSPLLKSHPEWFVQENGRIAHPSCDHDGQRVIWEDLAQFDHQGSPDREALFRHCVRVVEYLCGLGFRGFRCDAAYQLPKEVWRRLIRDIRAQWPEAVFVAETLGCSPEETRQTAEAGFDAIFNSSKWWDFSSDWLLEQYRLTREVAPSISFPESHDTPRLMEESYGNIEELKQRYLFAALFSGGVMMPMGYEFGFRRPMHVVETRPEHWENTDTDISDFIQHINGLKARYPVFQEDGPIDVLGCSNPAVLVMRKAASRGQGEALLVLNKDPWNRQHFHAEDLYDYVRSQPPLLDVSPEWPLDYLPTPFEFELSPGMGRILVADAAEV